MHIGYVSRERPPFSALDFRSGAYHFIYDTIFRSGASPFYFFFAVPAGDHHFHNFFTFKPFFFTRGRPAYCSQPELGQRPGVSGRPECQPDASYIQWQFWRPPLSRSSSGAPHFHARARSGAPPFFTLPRHIPIEILGEYPPPPPGRGSLMAVAGSTLLLRGLRGAYGTRKGQLGSNSSPGQR